MGKQKRILSILDRWVTGEITTAQGNRELKVAGVKLPKGSHSHEHKEPE